MRRLGLVLFPSMPGCPGGSSRLVLTPVRGLTAVRRHPHPEPERPYDQVRALSVLNALEGRLQPKPPPHKLALPSYRTHSLANLTHPERNLLLKTSILTRSRRRGDNIRRRMNTFHQACYH